jgi:hypothetical protein
MYVQIIWKLQPTSGELKINIIKEAVELLGDEVKRDKDYAASTSNNVSCNFLHFIYLYFCCMVYKTLGIG